MAGKAKRAQGKSVWRKGGIPRLTQAGVVASKPIATSDLLRLLLCDVMESLVQKGQDQFGFCKRVQGGDKTQMVARPVLLQGELAMAGDPWQPQEHDKGRGGDDGLV